MFSILVGLSLSFGLTYSHTVNAAPNAPTTTTTDPNSLTDSANTTCTIQKIGYILCPFLEVTSKAADQSFNLLANNFLKVETSLYCSSGTQGCQTSGTEDAWKTARDIANVLFVIAFLFLIYSQITGMGASNYGIKKMLPRLIVAAILVNTSYYICQGIVDITNILGFEIKGFLWDIAKGVGPCHALDYAGDPTIDPTTGVATAATPDPSQGTCQPPSAGGNGSGGNGPQGFALYAMATAILATAAIVFAYLGMLGSIVVAVIITCLIIVIILLLRKAIIVLLIVMSPLAFVAYLLPNTEKLYKKWLDMFTKLLLVFPIVSLLFGAGQLASSIILNAGTQSGQATTMSTGLIAAGIAIAPLMAVYAVLRGALAAAGAIHGAVNNLGSKAAGAAGKWAKDRDGNNALARGRAARKEIKAANRTEKFNDRFKTGADGKFEDTGARAKYTRAAAGGLAGVASRAKYGGVGAASMDAQWKGLGRTAASQSEKHTAELVAGEAAKMRMSGGDSVAGAGKKLTDAIEKGDMIGAKAAEDLLMGMGGAGADEFAKTIARAEAKHDYGSTGRNTTEGLKAYTMLNHAGVKDKSAGSYEWAKNGAGSESKPKMTMAKNFQNPGSYSGLSDKQRATQSAESAKAMSNNISATDVERLEKSAAADDMGGTQRDHLHAGGYTPPAPPQSGPDSNVLHR